MWKLYFCPLIYFLILIHHVTNKYIKLVLNLTYKLSNLN